MTRLTTLASITALIAAAAIAAAPAAHATPLAGSSIPQPVSPADGAQIAAGTVPTFVIQRGPGGSNYGGRYDGSFDIYGINVSADPTTLSTGVIQSEADSSGFMTSVTPGLTWQWTPFNRSYLGASWWLNKPGVYWWQPYRSDCYQDTDCKVEGPLRKLIVVAAPAPTPPPAPALPPIPDPPAPAPEPAFDWTIGLSRDPIPLSRSPKRSHRSFYVNDRIVPDEIDQERWLAIVEIAGQRWGSEMLGTTGRRPVRDGQNTVGFGSTEPDVLGSTGAWYRVSSRLRCGRVTCKRIYRRSFTGEWDMTIKSNAGWQQGPGYPDDLTFDLETVLIHEMGHLAGNDHISGCVNSPMIVGINRGEWWRSITDWHFDRCGGRLRAPAGSTTAVAASPASQPRLRERVVWRDTGDGYMLKQTFLMAD